MVVLRLKRMGRAHRPFYRLGAMDKRNPRDGRVIEELGWYDPIAAGEQIKFDTERVKHWLSVGAQPSDTVRDLLRKVGVETKPAKGSAKAKK
jgi:small subunit ribosomal protein S16